MVIVNPYARGGVSRVTWLVISDALKRAGVDFDHAFTEEVGHGIELAKGAAEKGHELVIAVGGDGTVNEVVNGLVDDEGKGKATLGIISAGSVGDFGHMMGLPRTYANSCRMFADYKKTTVDLGMVEYFDKGQKVRRFYINTAGVGFVSDVVRGADRRMKFIGGTVPYAIGMVPLVIRYRNKDVVVNIDGDRTEERDFVILVNNGRYLGGGKVFPDADPSDGLLDVAVVGDMSKLQMITTLPRFYVGTHIGHDKIRMCQAKSIEVDSPQQLPLQVDGELVGQTPVSFRVVPAALTVATGGYNG
jgi:YegS/Rv2252/BmrU family lipid kinase